MSHLKARAKPQRQQTNGPFGFPYWALSSRRVVKSHDTHVRGKHGGHACVL